MQTKNTEEKKNCIIEQKDGDSCCYLLFVFYTVFSWETYSPLYKRILLRTRYKWANHCKATTTLTSFGFLVIFFSFPSLDSIHHPHIPYADIAWERKKCSIERSKWQWTVPPSEWAVERLSFFSLIASIFLYSLSFYLLCNGCVHSFVRLWFVCVCMHWIQCLNWKLWIPIQMRKRNNESNNINKQRSTILRCKQIAFRHSGGASANAIKDAFLTAVGCAKR